MRNMSIRSVALGTKAVYTQSVKDFTSCIAGILRVHSVPPEVGKNLVRQQNIFGKKIAESMRQGILIVAGQLSCQRL